MPHFPQQCICYVHVSMFSCCEVFPAKVLLPQYSGGKRNFHCGAQTIEKIDLKALAATSFSSYLRNYFFSDFVSCCCDMVLLKLFMLVGVEAESPSINLSEIDEIN